MSASKALILPICFDVVDFLRKRIDIPLTVQTPGEPAPEILFFLKPCKASAVHRGL
jgi:hypothetical protein